MRMTFFASRNLKEITRDPISVLLGLALPIGLLVLFTSISRATPVETFEIASTTPGMAVFGFSFLTMFSAILMAKDEQSSFLLRLFASPLSAADYVAGYALPLVPVALVQLLATFVAAFALGLPVGPEVLVALLTLLPSALVAVAAGLLMGSVLTQNQVIGVGNVYIIVAAIFGGAWMDLHLLGGTFETVGYALPFAHGIDAARGALAGDLSSVGPHLAWVAAYAVVLGALAVMAFRRRLRV